jgi:hypothetical protein
VRKAERKVSAKRQSVEAVMAPYLKALRRSRVQLFAGDSSVGNQAQGAFIRVCVPKWIRRRVEEDFQGLIGIA